MKSPRRSAAGLLLAAALLYALYTLVPALAYGGRGLWGSPAQEEPLASPTPSPTAAPSPEPPAPESSPLPGFLEGAALPDSQGAGDAVFTLYDLAAGQPLTVPEEEFLAAAIACEMDLSSPPEALKAQAVAAYTYYSRQRAEGAEITCDSENWLVYVPQSAMQARWGEDFGENMALLESIVEQVEGQLLTWQGEPAHHLFCHFPRQHRSCRPCVGPGSGGKLPLSPGRGKPWGQAQRRVPQQPRVLRGGVQRGGGSLFPGCGL